MRLAATLTTLAEGVGIAIEALRANKVRAGLTIMGVAVGVFVVVAMSSIVKGINDSFAKDLEAAGPNSFWVYRRADFGPQACDGTDETCPSRRNPQLTFREAQALERLPSLEAVVVHNGVGYRYRYKDRQLSAGAELYTPNWLEVDGGDIYPGRSFTYTEYATAARVALVNVTLAEGLFQGSDPIGKEIYVRDVPFEVIGVYDYTASPMGTPTSAGGGTEPKAIIPFSTATRYLGARERGLDFIIKPRPEIPLEVAVDEVTATLRAVRALRPSQRNNFEIVTQERLQGIYDQLFGTIFIVLIALGSVGLLVGGVGVIAIMMISVTERTREIGVRKALGATKATILWQFLVEAVTLTGIGAMLGLIAGIGLAFLIRSIWPAIPAAATLQSVLTAMVITGVTGVMFGLLPAMRAARLDPVAALRYE